jgi:hypothetical protein
MVLHVLQIKDELYLLSCSIKRIDVLAEVEYQIEKIYHFVSQDKVANVLARLIFLVEETNTYLNSFVVLGHKHTNSAVLLIVIFQRGITVEID